MKLDEDIIRICSEHGLEARSVSVEGDVALIVPDSLDTLVDPDALAGIADEVRQFGIKHVALDLEPTSR